MIELFKKKKYATINIYKEEDKQEVHIDNNAYKAKDMKEELDDELWIKCKKCNEILLKEDVESNYHTCNKCGHHFRISARDRIKLILDKGSFVEYDKELSSSDPLNFPGYQEKVSKAMEKTGEAEAVATGEGKIKGIKVVLCVMDPNFMMGSMGCVVGEKITRAIERATEKKLPIIIFTASGGARMQEGMLSLMQMGKTSAALSRLSEAGLPYITVLTDPTTGGVTASFAMLGDIILAEPEALIGFAGPRVIEQTIRQKLPEGFQRSEFLLEKGFVDKIVHRKDMKETLYKILFIHSLGGEKNE